MPNWKVQEAKARFSEFLDAVLAEGPQIVAPRGKEAAVMVRIDQWRSLQKAARPTLKELLLAREPRCEDLAPKGGRLRRRRPVKLG